MKILRSNRIAFVHDGREITYSRFLDYIQAYSNVIEKSDSKVGILMENRPEWLFSLYALWKKDCAAVPMDYMSKGDDLNYIVKNSGIERVFCSDKTKDLVEGKGLEVINVDRLDLELEKGSEDISFPKDDKLGAIIYTSGTSGKPLGVMLSRKNIISNLNSMVKILDWPKYASFYTFVPMFHSAGFLAMAVISPYLQLTLILSDKISSEVITNTLQKYKVSIFAVIPRFAYMLHNKLMQNVNSSILAKTLFKISRFCNNRWLSRTLFRRVYNKFGGNLVHTTCGGAGLDPEVQRDLAALSIELFMGYGTTEASPAISYSNIAENRFGSAGKVLPGVKVKIEDGEIVVKGPNVSKGYYKNPKKTSEKFKDGWFYTGDLGEFDKDGFLYIKGRKKEVIVLSNGKNIWPQTIEDEIEKKVGIVEEIGLFEDRGTLKCVVKPNLDFAVTNSISNISSNIKDKISDYNISVPDYQQIKEVIVTSESLPRTRIGKLKRFLLPTISKEKKSEAQTKKMNSKEYAALEEFFLSNFNKQITPDSHIELDLSMDSIGRVDFIEFVQNKFSVKMELEDLAKNPLIKDIVSFIRTNTSKVKALGKKIKKHIGNVKINRTFMKVARFVSSIFMDVKVIGAENVPNRPVLMVANHLSVLDWYAIAIALGEKSETTLCLGKDKLMKNPLSRFIAESSNTIVFNVDRNVGEALENIKIALQGGNSVNIFPEGARSRDGSLLEFKKTFARIAKEAEVDVVPIRIDGTFELMPPGSNFPKRGKVRVSFGKPISYTKNIDDIVNESRSSIEKMLDKADYNS